jgi:hypothetical protein
MNRDWRPVDELLAGNASLSGERTVLRNVRQDIVVVFSRPLLLVARQNDSLELTIFTILFIRIAG